MIAALARWFGRTLAVWLIAVMPAALVIESLVSSLADPGFYVARLRNAGAYDAILDETVEPAVEDALDSEAGRASGLSARRVIAAARRALPPRWVYGQLETQLGGLLGYLAGDRGGFAFRINLKSRIPNMIAETRSLALDADAQSLLIDGVMPDALADAAAEMRSYGLDVDAARLKRSAAAILAEDWLDARLGEIIDEAGPYIAGETDSFEILIPLDQPLAAAKSEVRGFVAEVDWYDAVLEGVVSSYVDESLKDVDKSLGGFTINREDVLAIIRSSVTREIAEPAIESAASQLTDYFLGESDAASVSIDLTEAKRRAAPQIGNLAVQIADARALTLPPCRADAAFQSVTIIIFGVRTPGCIPQNEPARSLAQEGVKAARAEIGDAFIQTVLGPMPDAITFTQVDVRREISANAGEGALDAIDAVRSSAQDGIRYTSQDLETHVRELYGSSALAGLRDTRNFLQNGWSFDQSDMRDAVVAEAIDIPRMWFPYARMAAFGGIALCVIVAALSGALMGRSARSRILFACGVFALAGAVCWTLFEPVYTIYVKDLAAAALRDAASANNVSGGSEVYAKLIQDIALDAMSGILRRASIGGAICFAAGGTVALIVLAAKPRPPKRRDARGGRR